MVEHSHTSVVDHDRRGQCEEYIGKWLKESQQQVYLGAYLNHAFKALKTTDDGKVPQTTPQWIEVKSHVQQGGYECRYYVMHWIWNIIIGELKTDWSLVPVDGFEGIIDEGVAKVVAGLALKVSDRNKSIEKATEVRLGLPGCESPEREGVFKSVVVSGAKRGFSDAIDGNCNGGGSEKDVAALFSPTSRGAVSVSVSVAKSLTLTTQDYTNHPIALGASVLCETVPHSPKPLHENKPQICAPAAK
ncbi:hypothetical protein JHK84_050559 [Glycine max]|nr:hypothetical protein JHK86_050504 [Glycine max]KAG5094971.1 hypothetical protein JHK84_050559 [Glycine max]